MDLRHTIERLSAAESIRDLVYRYSHLIDRGELAEVAELFADARYGQCDGDGVPVGVLIDRDPAAVLRANESFIRMHGDPPSPRTKHLTTNVRVTVADNNIEASSLAYVTVLQGTGELPLQPILTGRYFDRFALLDRQWRFTERLCCIDHVGNLSEHARRALA
ncbi:nuclear transport factor 2 family protein [Rhodococcus sp. NPDC127528]|uniref:nuclear transport factor 2 family protein n=1 Tax=unclassified Rhodococcus (in: high G+C Gram-positive bacteria) TaxID=192944 RepID=UPI00363D1143